MTSPTFFHERIIILLLANLLGLIHCLANLLGKTTIFYMLLGKKYGTKHRARMEYSFSAPSEIVKSNGLLFDMDGTIIDSTDAIVKHWEK